MNKVLVKLYVPLIESDFDVWLPVNRKIGNIIILLIKALNEFSMGYYEPDKMPILYDRLTSVPYDMNMNLKEANINNGSEIVLI